MLHCQRIALARAPGAAVRATALGREDGEEPFVPSAAPVRSYGSWYRVDRSAKGVPPAALAHHGVAAAPVERPPRGGGWRRVGLR